MPIEPAETKIKEIQPMRTGITAPGVRPRGRTARLALVMIAGCLLWGTLAVGQARAAFGIQSIDGTITDQNGGTFTQAGGHPFALSTSVNFTTTTDSSGNVVPSEDPKDIHINLPPGLVGDPQATPQCTEADFTQDLLGTNECPASTQIGTATLVFGGFGSQPFTFGGLPINNLVPPAGQPAEFGFRFATVAVRLDVSVRPGPDYGVSIDVKNVSQGLQVIGTTVTLWGVPADPAHDADRQCAGGAQPCAAGTPLKPFLTLPTACLGPQTTTMTADSWQHPGDFQTASFVSHDTNGNPIGMTGCGRLDFSPSITVQPDTSVADSPSGLNVDLHVPQNDDPAGLAEANLESATVTLPAGISVNPSAANGLTACSPAQIGLDNASEPSCPNASKIGSVEIDTPLLSNPLKGSVYIAQQNNNPFDSLLAIYVTAEDQASGVLVKLAGHVVADPVTGQLTTVFSNSPQLPFSDFKLDFFGGSRGVLTTPEQCGTYSAQSSLAPWSGTAPLSSSDSFAISSGCVSGFAPSFSAGTENAQAGAQSPFMVSFSRSDADQDLSGLSVKLPPGMLAKLAGVQECSDAQLAAAAGKSGSAELASPSCPAGSQVGTVTTTAGAGPAPVALTGNAYLTGAYKGAPYGLAVVVPAVAGPYDLGTVVVRQALQIDPTTAQVTDVSDPLPTILDGIPLRIRRVDVDLNRPGFTVNPTSCDPMSVTGTLTSAGGISSDVSSGFQVGGCSSLGFSPRLKVGLSGKGKTRSGDHPTLTATLTQGAGQANIHSARVALPLSMALDPNNSQHVCAFATAQAVHGGSVGCPASTVVGTASVVTPLLSQPLSGKVYLVQGIRFSHGQQIRTLPSLLIPLRGQIALDLRAKSSVSGGKLVTTFSSIPDAPVSKFVLQINGGSKGLLVITGQGRSICGKAQMTNANLGAQSGKTISSAIKMSTPCPAVKHAKHKK